MNNIAIQKIAKLLRTPTNVLVDLFAKMEKITGKKGVAENIYEKNQKIVRQKLADLGILEEKADAQYVETELLKKIREADDSFYEFLGKPNFSAQTGCQKMIDLAKEVKPGEERGFFLKEDKLKNFVFLNPPQNIIKSFGYKDVTELLDKENIYHIFAALRFAEHESWLNNFFLRPYHDLIPENFEEREIRVEVLPEKWGVIGKEYVGKKLHHISHLKEAGYIFIVPSFQENYPGKTLEDFTLTFHYLYELQFYSDIFKKYSTVPNFGTNLVNLIKADVSSMPLPKNGPSWRIVQRYLAKSNESDPRLFEPHINPEPLHWLKAEIDIDRLAGKEKSIKLDFWRGVDDFVGEVLPAGKKGEEVVSFDLIDNIIFLSRGGIGRYMYHQQEALWNKIFIEFMGVEKLEQELMDNLTKGFIELK